VASEEGASEEVALEEAALMMEGEIEWIREYPENHYETLSPKSQGDH
jgi:hypothetical protein